MPELDPADAVDRMVAAGYRSLLAVQTSARNQELGIAFWSQARKRFTAPQIPAARRIADLIALAVSHEQLAFSIASAAIAALVGGGVATVLMATRTPVASAFARWLGVDEAGTGIVAATLGLGPAAGVTLAIVRRARVAAWTFVGLGLLLRRASPASVFPAARRITGARI